MGTPDEVSGRALLDPYSTLREEGPRALPLVQTSRKADDGAPVTPGPVPPSSPSADPKPARRIRADRLEWERIVHWKLGPCRVCGRGGTTLHHLVPRSLGGDDVADNIVPLCGHGTRGCHGAVEDREGLTCSTLRSNLTPAELRYVLGKKGSDFLERYYPADLDGAAAPSTLEKTSAAAQERIDR